MSTFNARGLVIRDVIVGESDKIIILLLKEIGKLTVSAKGARKAKSKFLAGTQLFSYADFVIYDGGKFNSLCEVSPIDSFYGLRKDFDRLCRGNLLLEIADKTILEKMPCDDILRLMLVSLTRLSRGATDPALITAVFELKYLQLNGYGAVTEYCTECGNDAGGGYFGINGVICNDCAASGYGKARISPDALMALDYILSSEIKDLFKFRADRRVTDDLLKAAELMMDANFEARFKSREMLGF